jgi:Xaa-Pro aminopeptidase
MLTAEGCRARQQRALSLMEKHRCDLFVTGNYRTVYYFAGVLQAAESPSLFVLRADGSSVLVSPAKADQAAATEVIPLETYSIARSITHPAHDAVMLLKSALAGRASESVLRCAIEPASVNILVRDAIAGVCRKTDFFDATDLLLHLRKKKEDDEIAEIRGSLRYCALAYRAAKETIAPGLTEIDVYNAMNAAIVRDAGTVVHFAGDFACGERSVKGGGPPTNRVIRQFDLYPLDIFPAPALYFGDTCRTFSVGEPTDVQMRAWELIMKAIRIAEGMIRPGVRAKDVYHAVKDFLDSHDLTERSFWHHAGHGIGHHGHEAPRIIPGSDDVFETGDVFTIEPGIYTAALQGGLRLEDNYVVREHSLENLFDFPMDLR